MFLYTLKLTPEKYSHFFLHSKFSSMKPKSFSSVQAPVSSVFLSSVVSILEAMPLATLPRSMDNMSSTWKGISAG